ncbi:MAG TPA: 50S ribosomal protein L25/general stress protein Ctc [Haliangiales bacterium]|nr:50S ribosomal protein L25/general stress protein Ctc [Haliangiales bacterium]
METGKLTVEHRKTTGKNEARRLRAAGKVPGICYGKGAEPLPISLDAKELKKALDPEKRQNTVIHLTVAGDGGKTLTVMLKDYQVDPLRQEVEHVDLVVVDVTKDVTVEVPVVVAGKAVGVVDGGQLHIVHRTLSVVCKPEDIPTKLTVDVTPLKIGDVIHVGEMTFPKGVKAVYGASEAVVSVVAPKAEKTAAEEQAAAEAAAAAAAPGAEGAVAAAPAAAGAAPAAAAPAKGGEAKAEAKPAKEAKK